MSKTLCKPVWRCLKNLKLELLYDPTKPIRGVFLKEARPRGLALRPASKCVFSSVLTSEALTQLMLKSDMSWQL